MRTLMPLLAAATTAWAPLARAVDDPPEAPAVGQLSERREPASDQQLWSVGIEVGAEFLLMEDSDLGKQLARFGYTFTTGLVVGVAVERALLDWLDLGARVVWANATDEREDRLPKVETRFDRVTLNVFVEAAYCIVDRCANDFGVEFGAQLGVGGGATIWSLGDEASVSAHLQLEPSLVWNALIGDIGLNMRISYAFFAHGGLGPMDLAVPLTWTPSVNIGMAYRW